MKVYRGSRGVAHPILNPGTGWQWSASRSGRVTTWKESQYPLKRMLSGLQSRSGCREEEKI